MAKEDADLTVYADKAGTAMQLAFAEWLVEETGFDPASAKTKQDAFERGVILGAYLRPTFQSSTANREQWAERRANREDRPAKAAKPAKAAPAKAAAGKAAKAALVAPAKKGGPRKASAKPAADANNNSPF